MTSTPDFNALSKMIGHRADKMITEDAA